MGSQFGICAGDGPVRAFGIVAYDHHCARLCIASSLHPDYQAVSDPGLPAERCFEILGIDVHSFGGDNYILPAPFEIEIARFVQSAQIAGAEPFAFPCCDGLSIYPICLCDAVAAYENLSGVVKLDLASRQRFADRAAPKFEGMIQTDERGRLGESVALDDREPQPSPEFLVILIERGPTADDRPEL